jgi:hypothetical protein
MDTSVRLTVKSNLCCAAIRMVVRSACLAGCLS